MQAANNAASPTGSATAPGRTALAPEPTTAHVIHLVRVTGSAGRWRVLKARTARLQACLASAEPSPSPPHPLTLCPPVLFFFLNFNFDLDFCMCDVIGDCEW